MKPVVFFGCILAAGWIAIGGVVALIGHQGVMEVVALELAALVLAIVGTAVLIDDVLGPRG